MTDVNAERGVLVVDDDPVSRLVVEHVLTGAGYEVVTAADAVAATELLANPRRFDVVVCDYEMPEATGLDVLEYLRELKAGTPFVLLTGFGDAADLDDERTELVDAFLTKPVLSEQLLAVVERLAALVR